MDKSNRKLTVLAAHFSDQVEERQSQWRLLLKRASTLQGNLLTLCDHNSLLFPTAEALQPSAVSDAPAVVIAGELEFQWLRDTALHDCWLQIHTPPDDRD